MSTALSVVVICINIYFVKDRIDEHHVGEKNWGILVAIGIYAFLYLAFCLYLSIHVAISMGATSLANNRVRKKNYLHG